MVERRQCTCTYQFRTLIVPVHRRNHEFDRGTHCIRSLCGERFELGIESLPIAVSDVSETDTDSISRHTSQLNANATPVDTRTPDQD